eukprot:jgi/Ulvmu1/10853/UM007_0027.1
MHISACGGNIREWVITSRMVQSPRGTAVGVFLALVCLTQLGALIMHSVAAPPPHRKFTSIWDDTHAAGDLPELASSHGPNSAQWSNSVAICATMKDENSTDVREWLLYYQWLGVDHVYLSENTQSPTPTLRSQVDDFVRSGFLTYSTEPMIRSQLKVYYDCMKQYYTKHNWLAFIDIDEFLILRSGGSDKLPDFLDAYKQYPGLSVHWVLVGPSGRRKRPASGGVLRHYPQCTGKGRHMVKTIANTFFLTNIATHPHNFEFRAGMQSVDEMARPVPLQDNVLCEPRAVAAGRRAAGRPPPKRRCHRDAGFKRSTASVAKAALFHFATKSEQDFEVKVHRGSAMQVTGKKWTFFHQIAQEAKERGGLCDLPAAAASQCCPPDALTLPM